MAGKVHLLFCTSLILLIAAKPSLAADHCGEVRLDAPGGTMEHVPVRDQGDFGDCFAVVAAEMDDAYRKSHGGSQAFNTSAIDGTIELGLHLHDSLIDALDAVDDDTGSANTCDVANYQKKIGLCDESVVEENPSTLGQDLKFLARSYDVQVGPKSNTKTVREFLKEQTCSGDESGSATLAATRTSLMAVLKSITGPVEARVVRELSVACHEAMRRPLEFSSCENSPGDYIPLSQHRKTEAFLLSMIKSRKSQPIDIGYCSTVLYKGMKYEGLNPTTDDTQDGEKPDCGGHYSMIIGKGPDPKTGKCAFLIQNSWGTDCSQYSRDWACEKTGRLWIDADVLSRNIDEYHYLK